MRKNNFLAAGNDRFEQKTVQANKSAREKIRTRAMNIVSMKMKLKNNERKDVKIVDGLTYSPILS